MLKNIINITIYKSGSHYVAECLGLPVISQGVNLDETVHNIKEALSLHLDGENMSEHGFIDKPIVNINMDLGEFEYA